MTDSQQFRADGHAAIDWAADYLEGIRDRGRHVGGRAGRDPREPARLAARGRRAVLGRARRPRQSAAAGHHALEPPALLRLLLDHGVASGHPRGAALGDAECERDALADIPGGNRAGGADALVARPAARLSRRAGTGTSRIRPRSRRSRRCARRAARMPDRPRRRRVRARALVDRPRVPHPRARDPPCAGGRRLPHAHGRARPDGRLRRRGHRRHDLDDVGRSRAGDRGCRRGGRCVAARRRRLCRLGARVPGVPHARAGARRLARRQPAQVAVHARRLLVHLHGAARRPARGLCAHARVPAHIGRGRDEPQRVRPGARPALPRAQAVVRAALLRPLRAAGADPRARAAGRAVRGLGARRARLGGLRAAPLLGRVLPARRATTLAARRCSRPSTRVARPTSRIRGWTTATCSASRSATPGRRRPTCTSPGMRYGARRPAWAPAQKAGV